jgi:hypothetical protein
MSEKGSRRAGKSAAAISVGGSRVDAYEISHQRQTTQEPRRQAASERPLFRLVLRPQPRVDGERALRALLKTALRRFGLRCISAERVRP